MMKPMKDFEGIYSITDDGKVWSHRANKFIEPKIYGKMKNPGYRLYKDSIGSVFSIHTLLHINFLEENPEFKYIEGYEGLYGVSTNGRVWSYKKCKVIVAHPSTTSAYLYVNLYKDNHGRKFSVHRLIAQTYIPNPDNLPEVDHIDRNIYNNTVNNLRWTTRKGNLLNTEIGFLRNFKNCQLYYQGKFIDCFKSMKAAARYARDNFGASFSGILRNMHSGDCEIKV